MGPERNLERLLASDLFSTDFPARSAKGAAKEAIQRTPDFGELVDDIRVLGKAKYELAVPALTQLWNECALVPVRKAAGFALRSIGAPRRSRPS